MNGGSRDRMGILSCISGLLLVISCSMPILDIVLRYLFKYLKYKQINSEYFMLICLISYVVGFFIALINFITNSDGRISKVIFISYIAVVLAVGFIFSCLL